MSLPHGQRLDLSSMGIIWKMIAFAHAPGKGLDRQGILMLP